MYEIVQSNPGYSAKQIARAMRKNGLGFFLRKRDVNPHLYSRSGAYVSDGGQPPLWQVAGQGTARGASGGAKKRAVGVTKRPLQPKALPRAGAPKVRRPAMPKAAPVSWKLSLWRWQEEAVSAWYQRGCSGIVEAVTGTGKTHVGMEAIAQSAKKGTKSTVLVPTGILLEQWRRKIEEHLGHLDVFVLPTRPSRRFLRARIQEADVVIALVHRAVKVDLGSLRGGLLVADEAHRYAAKEWKKAMHPSHEMRLGLTATLERSGDEGVQEVLRPYFAENVKGRDGLTFQYQYAQAAIDGVVAPFDLEFKGVDLSARDQDEYDDLTDRVVSLTGKLKRIIGVTASNQKFFSEVKRIAGWFSGEGRMAKGFLKAVGARRRLLADNQSKQDALKCLSDLITAQSGTLVFTETKDSANQAAANLWGLGVKAKAIHGDISQDERQQEIDALAQGRTAALVAPKILDEGVDVPNVDLGIVLAASNSRRQMIQRLGRVIRRKSGRRSARFIILYARGTIEDPALGAQEDFLEMVRSVAQSETIT